MRIWQRCPYPLAETAVTAVPHADATVVALPCAPQTRIRRQEQARVNAGSNKALPRADPVTEGQWRRGDDGGLATVDYVDNVVVRWDLARVSIFYFWGSFLIFFFKCKRYKYPHMRILACGCANHIKSNDFHRHFRVDRRSHRMDKCTTR